MSASPPKTTIWHDAFYQFAQVDDPAALVGTLQELCRETGVLGNVLVAHEGVNGMLGGTDAQLSRLRDFFAADERFAAMTYKRTACDYMPFRFMRVRLKREIVPLGVEGVDARKTGTDVSPQAWRELIAQDDVVLIDNRNRFEYELGHFEGAVDPGVHNFRDFAAYAETQLSEWQGKRVAMYCTGGIRCEKTSAWLTTLGLDVYQLEGGILNYFAQLPDADKEFKGECFVFDDRLTLDTKLQETPTTLAEVTALQLSLEPPQKPTQESADKARREDETA